MPAPTAATGRGARTDSYYLLCVGSHSITAVHIFTAAENKAPNTPWCIPLGDLASVVAEAESAGLLCLVRIGHKGTANIVYNEYFAALRASISK
jgi:hypothetical protein